MKSMKNRIRAFSARMLILSGILCLSCSLGGCGSFSMLTRLKLTERIEQTETAAEAETTSDIETESASPAVILLQTEVMTEAPAETEVETLQETEPEETAPAETETAAAPLPPSVTITYDADGYRLSDDASDFVLLSEAVPDVILEIRYYSTYNFVGDRIDGYEEPIALLTKEAAAALKEASEELAGLGYRLKIYDAYRPQMAVDHFKRWALDPNDTRMKAYFYPELSKDSLFPLGYIAAHSGHSRGSTLDLTLFDMTTEKEADMGGTFDYFGSRSHTDYTGITREQYANRMLLQDVMIRHGFRSFSGEWWHFTLNNEPFPDTYFTFPVNSSSVE